MVEIPAPVQRLVFPVLVAIGMLLWLRPGMVAAGMALVLAAALLALLATPPADAAGRYKTVTKTFSSTTPIRMPELGTANPYPSEISVGGLRRGKVLDANLTLKGLSHPYPDDVDVMVSHGTTSRTVMSDTGSALDANNVTLTLDDEAASPLPGWGGVALATGTFKPTNLSSYGGEGFSAPAPPANAAPELSGFDGAKANGLWQLWVADDDVQDSGEFAGGWSVTIKARVLR